LGYGVERPANPVAGFFQGAAHVSPSPWRCREVERTKPEQEIVPAILLRQKFSHKKIKLPVDRNDFVQYFLRRR
jgi:hypothetical protein